MKISDYAKAQGWLKRHASSENSAGEWQKYVALNTTPELDEAIKTIDDKFGPGTVFPASEAPIPPMTDQQAIMEWNERNKKAGGGRIGFEFAGSVTAKKQAAEKSKRLKKFVAQYKLDNDGELPRLIDIKRGLGSDDKTTKKYLTEGEDFKITETVSGGKKYIKKAPEERWKDRSYPQKERKQQSLKEIFDTIFETEDWGGIKGDTPGLTKAEEKAGIKKSDPSRKGKTGGKIPNDWFRRHVSKAIQGDVDALNNLSSITGRSVKDLQNAFEKIEGAKQIIRSEAASKSSPKLNPKNKELVDLVNEGVTKKADLLDALKVTDDEFQKMVTLAFKQGYENRSKLNKNPNKKLTSYLGNTLEEYNNLIEGLNKIDGIDKARERLITSRIQQVYGKDGSHPSSKMFKTMTDRVNEFYKLKKTLPSEIALNLDHAVPMSVIEQLTEANTLRVNVQPITQSLNMGLKAQVDKAYAAAYKAGDKKTMRAIEEVAEKIDLPMGKITDTFTNLGKNPYLTGDMKQVIYNNLVIQNSISDKAKLLDKELLKKAGLSNVSFDVSKVDTETVAKLFSKGDANFAKFVKSVGNNEAGFIARELVEDTAKGLGKGAKVGGKFLGTALNLGTGPTAMAALTYGLKPEGGYDLSRTGDRIGFEAEAAFAKPLVEGTKSVTDKIKNPLFKKAVEYASGIRLPGISPANMLKAARIATPLGLGALGVEGVYNVAKYSEPNYYIGPDGEPTFYKREKAADVLPTMLDVYDQADKISREQGIPYQEALYQVNLEKFKKINRADGGIASLRRKNDKK